MPLFKPSPASDAKAAEPPPPPPEHEKPLPTTESPKRPGTSGTEALLVLNTRRASERFQQAQRAEKTYKAKKRSTVARTNLNEAKTHYREGFEHLRTAVKLTFAVARMSPYLLSEKKEQRQLKADEKKRRRAQERSKKLEEQLARERRTASEADETEAHDKEKAEAETPVKPKPEPKKK